VFGRLERPGELGSPLERVMAHEKAKAFKKALACAIPSLGRVEGGGLAPCLSDYVWG